MVLLDTETPGTSREIYSEDVDGETRTRNPWITNPVYIMMKLYFVEICEVSEKLWLFNHKRVDFGFQILDLKDHFSASLNPSAIKPHKVNLYTHFCRIQEGGGVPPPPPPPLFI